MSSMQMQNLRKTKENKNYAKQSMAHRDIIARLSQHTHTHIHIDTYIYI